MKAVTGAGLLAAFEAVHGGIVDAVEALDGFRGLGEGTARAGAFDLTLHRLALEFTARTINAAAGIAETNEELAWRAADVGLAVSEGAAERGRANCLACEFPMFADSPRCSRCGSDQSRIREARAEDKALREIPL